MRVRTTVQLVSVSAALMFASPARAYIHFPPMTLPKMCQHSMNIRVLAVKKFDPEKRVIIFEVVEDLKGKPPRTMSHRHVIPKDTAGVQPILDWVAAGKRVVMFSIEGGDIACGYVFIDQFCYSVDYNRRDDYWLLIRAEPNLSACYYGSVEDLQVLAKDLLAGKEVTVPVKESVALPSQEERDKRAKEVNKVLEKNRGIVPPAEKKDPPSS